MSKWMARARIEISKVAETETDKTDESSPQGLYAVSSVPQKPVGEQDSGLSSVLSVQVAPVFEKTLLAAELIKAAMKACDRYGDGEAAREEMRQQCLEVPPELQLDLLDHFKGR
jgi:hypothetical protein